MTRHREWRQNEATALALLERFHGRLPAEFVDYIRSLMTNNEWVIGVEDLCAQLLEYDIRLDSDDLKHIQAVADALKMPAKSWTFLIRPVPGAS